MFQSGNGRNCEALQLEVAVILSCSRPFLLRIRTNICFICTYASDQNSDKAVRFSNPYFL